MGNIVMACVVMANVVALPGRDSRVARSARGRHWHRWTPAAAPVPRDEKRLRRVACGMDARAWAGAGKSDRTSVLVSLLRQRHVYGLHRSWRACCARIVTTSSRGLLSRGASIQRKMALHSAVLVAAGAAGAGAVVVVLSYIVVLRTVGDFDGLRKRKFLGHLHISC